MWYNNLNFEIARLRHAEAVQGAERRSRLFRRPTTPTERPGERQ